MIVNPAELDTWKRIPPLRRSRNFRLYDHKGNRCVDLWQENGSLFAGHRPEHVIKQIKNEISKGLMGPLPSLWGRKLKQMIDLHFPGYRLASVHESLEDMVKAQGPYWDSLGRGAVLDKAKDPEDLPLLWRPSDPLSASRPLVVQAPGVGSLGWTLVLQPGTQEDFPPGVQGLKNMTTALGLSLLGQKTPEPQIPASLFHHPSLVWMGRGFLIRFPPEIHDQNSYAPAFIRFLEAGFLLPPLWDSPGFWPTGEEGRLSEGEWKKFKELLEVKSWKE